MSEDFFRPVKNTEAHKLRCFLKSPDSTQPGVRLYCTQVSSRWLLQVRAPLTLSNGRVGVDFIIAGSSLSLDDLRALRDACNRQLAEIGE